MRDPDDCPLDPDQWRVSLPVVDNADLLRWYWAWAQDCPPHPTMVEIGVQYGRSLTWLAGELLARGWDRSVLYGVDSWGRPAPPPHPGVLLPSPHGGLRTLVRYGGVGELDLIRLIGVPSLQAARCFLPASLDLVMIDGDHTYEGCYADIDAYLPLVRPGGVLAGHDYHPVHFPGVVQAVDERWPRGVQHHQRVWWVVMGA